MVVAAMVSHGNTPMTEEVGVGNVERAVGEEDPQPGPRPQQQGRPHHVQNDHQHRGRERDPVDLEQRGERRPGPLQHPLAQRLAAQPVDLDLHGAPRR